MIPLLQNYEFPTEIIIKIGQNALKYARKTILLSTGEYWQLMKLYRTFS